MALVCNNCGLLFLKNINELQPSDHRLHILSCPKCVQIPKISICDRAFEQQNMFSMDACDFCDGRKLYGGFINLHCIQCNTTACEDCINKKGKRMICNNLKDMLKKVTTEPEQYNLKRK